LAQRIHTTETETNEMVMKLQQPRGHRLVEEWNDARTNKAAEKVQSLWRKLKGRRKYATVAGKMDQLKAVLKLQAAFRRRKQERRPNVFVRAAQENPTAKPITHEKLTQHEELILKKAKEYLPDPTLDAAMQAERMEELAKKAAEKYRTFLESRPQERVEVARTYLHREQTREMLRALETSGIGFGKALPYGVCSASLLRETEERHRLRKAEFSRELWAHGLPMMKHTGTAIEDATTTVAIESQTEAAEADQLLFGLESDLGYDFSAERAAEPLPKAKMPDEAVFKAIFSGAGGYGSRIR